MTLGAISCEPGVIDVHSTQEDNYVTKLTEASYG